jgi:hypothetical protein
VQRWLGALRGWPFAVMRVVTREPQTGRDFDSRGGRTGKYWTTGARILDRWGGSDRIGVAMVVEERIRQSLEDGFFGELVTPADPDYDVRRRVWNGMVDRRPALIARCAGEDDVVAALRAAREHGLVVAIRGGGHNVAGNAVCDGGLVIDLSALKPQAEEPQEWRPGGCNSPACIQRTPDEKEHARTQAVEHATGPRRRRRWNAHPPT